MVGGSERAKLLETLIRLGSLSPSIALNPDRSKKQMGSQRILLYRLAVRAGSLSYGIIKVMLPTRPEDGCLSGIEIDSGFSSLCYERRHTKAGDSSE